MSSKIVKHNYTVGEEKNPGTLYMLHLECCFSGEEINLHVIMDQCSLQVLLLRQMGE